MAEHVDGIDVPRVEPVAQAVLAEPGAGHVEVMALAGRKQGAVRGNEGARLDPAYHHCVQDAGRQGMNRREGGAADVVLRDENGIGYVLVRFND